MSALLTGHCHLKERLLKLGMVDSHGCDRCHQALETAPHILCDCEALVVLRFWHLSHHFLQPEDSATMSISKILHFVQSAKLLNAEAKGCTRDQKRSRHKGPAVPALVYKHSRCMENCETLYHNMTHHA
jgi:hypothetical protein